MQTYEGGCHCGRVRFSILADLTEVSQCNCSICTAKGTLNHRVPPDRFTLLAGKDDLACYQFNTGTARHWFCRHCGIHPFANPRRAPDHTSVNVHCLDRWAELAPTLKTTHFDGRNWEAAVAAAKAASESPRA
jgi:hypothetical protein